MNWIKGDDGTPQRILFNLTDAASGTSATNTDLFSYYYDSAGTYYQIYARLENTLVGDVPTSAQDETQVFTGLNCGDYEGNSGVSSGNTTPDADRVMVVE